MNETKQQKKSWSTEIKSVVKLVLLLTIFIIVLLLISNGVNAISENYGLLLFILLYFFTVVFLNYISSKYNNKKYLFTIYFIYALPVIIFGALLSLAYPIMLISMSLIVFISMVFAIPILILDSIGVFLTLTIPENLSIYIIITSSFILSISFHKPILEHIVYRLLRFKTSEKIKEYKIESAVEYLINQKNIRFSFYSMYFVYLIYYSSRALVEGSSFDNNLSDYTVLQSFLTVLAFDSLYKNSKNIKLLPSVLYNKIRESYRNKYDI